MAQVYRCDICGEEQATTSVGNMLSGESQWYGPSCYPALGLAIIASLDPEVQDAVLKTIGYQPTKATKDARKAIETPEVDPSRTIAEIVEDQPRPPERIDTAETDASDMAFVDISDDPIVGDAPEGDAPPY